MCSDLKIEILTELQHEYEYGLHYDGIRSIYYCSRSILVLKHGPYFFNTVRIAIRLSIVRMYIYILDVKRTPLCLEVRYYSRP